MKIVDISEWIVGEFQRKNAEVARDVMGMLNNGLVNPEPFMWVFPTIKVGEVVSYPQLVYMVWIEKVVKN